MHWRGGKTKELSYICCCFGPTSIRGWVLVSMHSFLYPVPPALSSVTPTCACCSLWWRSPACLTWDPTSLLQQEIWPSVSPTWWSRGHHISMPGSAYYWQRAGDEGSGEGWRWASGRWEWCRKTNLKVSVQGDNRELACGVGCQRSWWLREARLPSVVTACFCQVAGPL